MDKWHDEKIKFYELINWMSGEERGLINKFDIGFITKDNRYIVAKDDIEADEILISIPNSSVLNIFHPDVAPIYAHIKDVLNNEMIPLSLFLLMEFEKTESKFKLFMDYLPKNLSEHPLFYSDGKRKMLKGSFLLDKMLIWEKQIEEEFDSLIKINTGEKFRMKDFSLEKYKFYRSLVWSRNFNAYYNGIGYSSLVPVADLCNTDPFKINTDWFYDEKTEQFIIKSIKKINKNDEIILRYGDEDNVHYLFFYGFTIENNPTKLNLYIYEILNKDSDDNEIVLKMPLELYDPLIKFRKSKVSTIKNLKIELNTLKLFKKSLLGRINGYSNKNDLEKDKQVLNQAKLDNDFDLLNINRVIIEEKEFLVEYIKAIELFSSKIEELIKIKSVKDFDTNELEERTKELESIDISINYKNSLSAYLKSC